MTRRVRFLTWFAAVLLTAANAAAQGAASRSASPRVPLLAVADGDSVRLYVFEPPPGAVGFTVSAGRTVATLTRIGTDTVRRAKSYLDVGEVLREQTGDVLRSANVLDEPALLRYLDNDPVGAALLMIFYPRVGDVMGRHWSGARPTADSSITFGVSFIDAAGRSVGQTMTTRLSMRPITPATPTAAKVERNGDALHVTWSYPAYRGGNDDITFGFNVYRAEAGGAPARVNPKLVVRDLDKTPLFDDVDVQPGKSYAYSVRGVDILGREGPASTAVSFRYADRAGPSVPADVTVRANGSGATVVWAMLPDPDVRGYWVERGTSLNQPFRRLNTTLVPADRPSFNDSTVATSTQYFYRVIAVDSAGNVSKESNPGTLLIEDTTPPPAPTALRATVLPRHRVQVSWTASAARDVVGYFVYRNEIGGPVTRLTEGLVYGTTYTDVGPDSIGLLAGGKYRISVTAIDIGNNESPKGSVEFAVPDDVPPVSPTSVHAQNILGRYVNFVWSPGGSPDVRLYTIERSVDGAPRARVADVAGNAAHVYKDTAVAHGRRYVYWVTAVDSVGNKSRSERDSLKFGDFTPPPSPRNAYVRRVPGTATTGARTSVSVHWERVIDPELVGYVVYRSNLATGEYTKVTATPVTGLTWTDNASPADAWYTVRAVDKSGNESAPSPPARVTAR
jgi:fibronectin type 3 domain-containing protein